MPSSKPSKLDQLRTRAKSQSSKSSKLRVEFQFDSTPTPKKRLRDSRLEAFFPTETRSPITVADTGFNKRPKTRQRRLDGFLTEAASANNAETITDNDDDVIAIEDGESIGIEKPVNVPAPEPATNSQPSRRRRRKSEDVDDEIELAFDYSSISSNLSQPQSPFQRLSVRAKEERIECEDSLDSCDSEDSQPMLANMLPAIAFNPPLPSISVHNTALQEQPVMAPMPFAQPDDWQDDDMEFDESIPTFSLAPTHTIPSAATTQPHLVKKELETEDEFVPSFSLTVKHEPAITSAQPSQPSSTAGAAPPSLIPAVKSESLQAMSVAEKENITPLARTSYHLSRAAKVQANEVPPFMNPVPLSQPFSQPDASPPPLERPSLLSQPAGVTLLQRRQSITELDEIDEIEIESYEAATPTVKRERRARRSPSPVQSFVLPQAVPGPLGRMRAQKPVQHHSLPAFPASHVSDSSFSHLSAPFSQRLSFADSISNHSSSRCHSRASLLLPLPPWAHHIQHALEEQMHGNNDSDVLDPPRSPTIASVLTGATNPRRTDGDFDGGYSFRRLSELRSTGQLSMDYDNQFQPKEKEQKKRTKPSLSAEKKARTTKTKRKREQSDNDSESDDAELAAGTKSRVQLIGHWYVQGGRKIYMHPSGRKMQGQPAFLAYRQLKEKYPALTKRTKKGAKEKAAMPNMKGKKKSNANDQEAKAERKQRKTSTKKSSTKKKPSGSKESSVRARSRRRDLDESDEEAEWWPADNAADTNTDNTDDEENSERHSGCARSDDSMADFIVEEEDDAANDLVFDR